MKCNKPSGKKVMINSVSEFCTEHIASPSLIKPLEMIEKIDKLMNAKSITKQTTKKNMGKSETLRKL